MNNIKSIVLLLFFSICHQALQAGGGWPQKKNKGFFKLGQSFIIADKYYSPSGDIVDITTLSLYTTSLYGEYGITDRFTAIAYLPVFVRSTLNEIEYQQSGNTVPGDELNSIGDVDLGFKYGLTQDSKVAVSVSLVLGLPLGETAGGNSKILQTGDGEFNQLVMLDAGRGYNKFYMNAGVGFNNRTNDFSDEFRYAFEIGYTGIKNVVATMKFNGVSSFENGNNSDVANNGVFANNTEYFAYGPELSYKIKDNFGVNASAFFAFSAKRILAAPNFGVGVFFTL